MIVQMLSSAKSEITTSPSRRKFKEEIDGVIYADWKNISKISTKMFLKQETILNNVGRGRPMVGMCYSRKSCSKYNARRKLVV